MFGKKIKVSPDLWAKLEQASILARCSSVEEFAAGILEAESDRVIRAGQPKDLSAEEVQAIENQLRGLGYLE